MSGKIYQGSHLVAQTNDAPLGFEDKGIELESLAQYEQLEKDGNLQEDVNYYIKDADASLEEIPLTWKNCGFDVTLADTESISLWSIEQRLHLYANETLIIDLGEDYATSYATVYMYWQAHGWLLDLTPTQRYYIFTNIPGRSRLGVNNGTDYSKLRIYKKKTEDWIPTIVKHRDTFHQTTATFYGDSIAYGHISGSPATVANPSFPTLFVNCLGMTQSGRTWNRAVSGSSYTQISGRTRILETITESLVSDNSDNLFIFAGVNDWASDIIPEDFRAAVKETFEYIHVNNNGRVYIISPIPVDKDVWTTTYRYDLDTYRRILEEESILYGFEYINGVDLGISQEDAGYYSDGLHLSQKGYNRLGMNLVNYLSNAIIAQDMNKMHPGIGWTNEIDSNGKPIYKYTYNGSNADNVGMTNVKLVRISGWFSDGINYVPVGWASGSSVAMAYLDHTGNINITLPSETYTTYEICFEFTTL